MNIFILTTGRTGSVTFSKACNHITNYTVGHESKCASIGNDRICFKDNHIEIDNRLCFYLGSLDKKYGDSAFYVHLIRRPEVVINSFNKRWKQNNSVIHDFANSIKMLNVNELSEKQKLEICKEYVTIQNDNIDLFLKNKSNKMVIRLDYIREDFERFWTIIGARGNMQSAINELGFQHNASKSKEEDILKIDLEKTSVNLLQKINSYIRIKLIRPLGIKL